MQVHLHKLARTTPSGPRLHSAQPPVGAGAGARTRGDRPHRSQMEKPHRGPGSVALPPSAPRQHHGARRAADSRVAADPRAPAGRSRRSHAALCQPLPVAERHLPLPLPSPAGPAPPLASNGIRLRFKEWAAFV